ncbi:hypothetical protein HYX10_05210 [Candidatus Woesearchaeota archaeon]|nr:hypothetical protein [Candidatus Woesearchaeota archaeon]
MPTQLFQEIRRIEDEAARLISDADKQSAEIVREAHGKAIALLSEKEPQLKQMRDARIREALEETAKQRQKKLLANNKALEELESRADRNRNKAVKLVLDQLAKLIGE